MTIAPTLQHYLDAMDADYELIEHSPTRSAIQNAALCHIPPERLAKAVLLDTPDDYLLAVLPSDRRVGFDDLRSELGQKPRLVEEKELASVFDDCMIGAVPPLGFGYGIAIIVDDSLADQPDIYFEGGDHASLIHMDQAEFARLTRPARHGRFSEPWATLE
jgi:Ala-tRNA(Pro) deacylase